MGDHTNDERGHTSHAPQLRHYNYYLHLDDGFRLPTPLIVAHVVQYLSAY